MSDLKRIEQLEAAVMVLAREVAQTAAIAVAQGVVIRALAEVLTQGACASVSDVHERALDMAGYMPDGVAASVRAMLAEVPAGSGARH